VADIRKHVNSGKVELPTTLRGLSRMFNNYCRLLLTPGPCARDKGRAR
jgi:hypothetical protein